MTRNTKKKTKQKRTVALKTKMVRHADHGNENVREAKVWKKGGRIDRKNGQEILRTAQKTVLRTVQRSILKIILRILETIVKIEIETEIEKKKEIEIMMDVINMIGKNVNEVVPKTVTVTVEDRQNQNVMIIIVRVKNEKYQVNEVNTKLLQNNDFFFGFLMPEKSETLTFCQAFLIILYVN